MKNFFYLFIILIFNLNLFSQNTAQVTFQVDMTDVVDPFTTPEVNGNFNSWCGNCWAMSDSNGDNIWEVVGTININTDYEFKFSADSWGIQESLLPGSPCTVTNFGFTNRTLNVSGDTTLPAFCWESCLDCGSGPSSYNVTFEVDMRNVTDPFTTPEVNGNFNGWCGSCWTMSDNNNDSIWEFTTIFAPGDSLEFKYSADNWSIQEELDSNLSCITINYDPSAPNGWGYVNRVAIVNSDTIFSSPWNSCSNLTNGCTDSLASNYDPTANTDDGSCLYSVVFNVDMNCDTTIFGFVHLESPYFGWCGGCVQMSDPDGDNIHSVIVDLPLGDFEYKYAVDYFSSQEDLIDDMLNGGTCAPITDYNTYANRQLTVSTGSIADDVYGSCDSCVTSGLSLTQIDLPISWDDTTVNYTTTPFGGINSSLSPDPLDSTNNVLMTDRTAGSPTWAGTTLSTPNGLANAIAFASGSTKISANIYSPFFGVVVRLKAEDHTDPTKSVETEATITTANGWSTLVFDFSNEAPGTATIDFSYNYDMLSIFFDFGNVPSSSTIYYLDSVAFGDFIFGQSGCTDSMAYNYNPLATLDDGSCSYVGCTDSTALNYDPNATADDGSCFYYCITPPSESFEYGFGNWQSYFSWVRTMGSTFTPNTGPSSAFDGNWYAYVESSFLLPGVSVWMDAGCVDLTSWNNPYFSFAYHMYGATIGSLEVKISIDGGNSWTTEWSKSGDQGNNWNEADIDLSNYSMYSYIKVRVFATVLAGDEGDIALDLLRFADLLPGCVDTNALNYDSIAGIDDGSCIYPELTVLSNISSPSCYGDIDGSIDITVSGGTPPYSYIWSNGETTEDIFLLSSDTFSVIVSDALGVSALDTFFVSPTDSIITSVTIVNASDSLTSDGAIYTSISGGTPPFTYFWNDGSNFFSDTTDYLLNISHGTYNQYIIDFNNCFLLNTFNVSVDIDTCLYGCMDFNSVNYDSSATCDDGSCSPFIYGCTDPSALNYYPGANTDDGSCFYPNCASPIPSGLVVNWTTDTKASVSWDNMNDMSCMVFKYFVRYRVVNSDGTYGNWVTKSAGVGNGLCNFGLNTTEKRLQLLTAATTYQFKMKAFYCGGTESGYSSPASFTTGADCPPMTNLGVQTFNSNQAKATFSWDTTGAYVFARIALRVDTTGATWGTAGGFGIYYPTLTVNKFGLTPGQSYRAQGRTFCDSNVTSYRSTWTTPVLWTQPGTLIRMESTSQIKNLDIYPNPSRDIFNIRFVSEKIQDLSIRVINIMGELVYEEKANQFIGEYTKKIDLTENSKGVYFLEITTNKGVVNRKIVIQ